MDSGCFGNPWSRGWIAGVLLALLAVSEGCTCQPRPNPAGMPPEASEEAGIVIGDKEPDDEDPQRSALDSLDRDLDPPPPGAAVAFGSTQFWHPAPVHWAAFAPDGKTLATVAKQMLSHWDVPAGTRLSQVELPGYKNWISPVVASRDFKVLATSGYEERTVRLWDLQTGQFLRTLEGFSAEIYRLQFSPDGKLLATAEGTDPPKLRLWTIADGKQHQVLEGHTKSVLSFAFSPDGKTLRSAGFDQTIRSFDVATGKQRWLHHITDKEASTANRSGYSSARFSMDGRLLALGSGGWSSDRIAWLYEVETGKQLRELGKRTEHRGNWQSIHIIGFMPDHKTLVAGDDGGTIYLWDTATGNEIIRLVAGSNQGALSADGKLLATFNGRQVYLWELPSGKLLIQPQFRTYLRPVVARLAAGDPFRVALHWAGPEGVIDYRIGAAGTIPFSQPFDGEYSKVETLGSMMFHVTTPDGKQHHLHARVESQDKKPSSWRWGLRGDPTFFFTLDQKGFQTGNQSNTFIGTWLDRNAPPFDIPGTYKLSLSGCLVLKPHDPLPFQSGEVQIECGVKGCLPLQEIRAKAIDQLRAVLAKEDQDKIKDDHSHKDHNGVINVVDNPRNVRIVRLAVYKDGYIAGGQHIDHYHVLVLPGGRVVQISIFSEQTCIAVGTPVETAIGPKPIEQLRVGDRVWGYDLSRRQPVLTAIRAIRRGEAMRMFQLTEGLRVTLEHPVWASGSWKPAGEVRTGEVLLGCDGKEIVIGRPRLLEGVTLVYDLSVNEPRTFFAGGVLVHNKSGDVGPGYFDPWKAFAAASKPYKKRIWLGLESLKAWQPGLERLSLADVKTDDAGLTHLRELHRLKVLDLTGCTVTDEGLANLKDLTKLEQLDLAGTQVRGSGLAHLHGLPALKAINLAGTPAINEALQQLGQIASLESVRLGRAKISDEGLAHLVGLKRLKGLYLNETAVSDAGLPHLKTLGRLEELSLAHTPVGDAALADLAAFRELRELDLAGTKITGAGLVHLKELSRLERLDLAGTRVDDRGLAHLRGLKNLKWLKIDNSHVTGEGLSYLTHLLDTENVQIVPIRLGHWCLDYLKLRGPGASWLARRIEEHRAEDYAIRKVVPAHG